MRMILLLLAVVVGLGLVVVIIGYLLPVKHVATVSATIPATPEQVWETLTNVAAYPTWRGDVTSGGMLPPDSGHVAGREPGKIDAISFVIEQADAPRWLVTRSTDKSLPFGGAWDYEITGEGAGKGSRVRITERGEVYNPVFRFMSRFVFGHTATIEAYLAALEKRLS
jgi:hypothetical protein